jgi:hypothetical protein
MKARRHFLAILGFSIFVASSTAEQDSGEVAAMIGAQREAQRALAALDGVWRGSAWTILPSGEKHDSIQTQRVGLMLHGSTRVIESRSYSTDGTPESESVTIISYVPSIKTYLMELFAQGGKGDFPLKVTSDGFSWEESMGTTLTLRYTVTVKEAVWHEIREGIVSDKKPFLFFEMTLKRNGDTDWPAQGAPPPK